MHRSFATTTRGLDRDLLPLWLYEKAKGASLDDINRVTREAEETQK